MAAAQQEEMEKTSQREKEAKAAAAATAAEIEILRGRTVVATQQHQNHIRDKNVQIDLLRGKVAELEWEVAALREQLRRDQDQKVQRQQASGRA